MSKPIAMRMNAEQFESIRGILEANKYILSTNIKYSDVRKYVACPCDFNIKRIYRVSHQCRSHKLIKEFNAKVFLNSLGIEYNEPQPTEQVERYNIFDKAQQLIKDAKQQGVEIEIKEGLIILKQVAK